MSAEEPCTADHADAIADAWRCELDAHVQRYADAAIVGFVVAQDQNDSRIVIVPDAVCPSDGAEFDDPQKIDPRVRACFAEIQTMADRKTALHSSVTDGIAVYCIVDNGYDHGFAIALALPQRHLNVYRGLRRMLRCVQELEVTTVLDALVGQGMLERTDVDGPKYRMAASHEPERNPTGDP